MRFIRLSFSNELRLWTEHDLPQENGKLTMTYRMIAAMFLFAALDLATATTAPAQSVADADNAMHAMDLRMRALNTARKNLQQLEHHRDDREADAARDITDADAIVFTAAVKVFTVAFIVTGMKCPDDARFAQKQFGLVVQSFVATADTELSRVNESLPNVAAPAALAEAINIRDVIVDLRDFLKPFAVEA
jgi:hypothetical protein